MSYFSRARFFSRKFRLGFRPGDLVLDVGSGNDPHPRADILCDKFVLDDTEREGRLVADRPIVGGDLEALPFRDQSIDFVIASHVLEHVTDPQKAVSELQRVAKRGYIETPAEFGGKLMDLPGHRWYVRQEGDTLIFSGKSVGMFDDHLNGVMFGMWKRDRGFMRFFWDHPDLFFVRYRWEGKIPIRVIPPAGQLIEPETFLHSNVEEARVTKSRRRSPRELIKDSLRDYYRSPFYGPARAVSLEALCACPHCGGVLAFEDDLASCLACPTDYPLLRSGAARVPMLLSDHARDRRGTQGQPRSTGYI